MVAEYYHSAWKTSIKTVEKHTHYLFLRRGTLRASKKAGAVVFAMCDPVVVVDDKSWDEGCGRISISGDQDTRKWDRDGRRAGKKFPRLPR
jgi:hypothetical protein